MRLRLPNLGFGFDCDGAWARCANTHSELALLNAAENRSRAEPDAPRRERLPQPLPFFRMRVSVSRWVAESAAKIDRPPSCTVRILRNRSVGHEHGAERRKSGRRYYRR